MKVLVTGAAGYVGSLLAEELAADPTISKVIATDRLARTELDRIAGNGKLRVEYGRLEEADMRQRLQRHLPLDAVIHAAFAIRAGYGKNAEAVERANLASCRNVFELCFRGGVKRLIYFSTAAVYGARPDNKADHFFREDDPLRENTYSYGVQKRKTEDLLRSMYEELRPDTSVVVVRPCAITGPRFLQEPTKKVTLVAFLKKFMPAIPELSSEWSRQYLHEDDLVKAMKLFLSDERISGYEVFNLAPGDYLTAVEIAQALEKRRIKLPASLVALSFKFLWHATRGKIPTPDGAVDFFKHPVNLDGSKITQLGFDYRYRSEECLATV
jgi:UDP-glucose 4-epimerase